MYFTLLKNLPQLKKKKLIIYKISIIIFLITLSFSAIAFSEEKAQEERFSENNQINNSDNNELNNENLSLLESSVKTNSSISTFDSSAAEVLFSQANEQYQNQNYQAAIENYEKILKNNYLSETLFYNLGNAYYKTGQLGKAILNYHRALKVNPRFYEAKVNLEYANQKTLDKITEPPQPKWLSILVIPFSWFKVKELIWSTSLIYSLLFLAIGAFLFAGKNSRKILIFISSVLLFLLIISSTLLTWSIYQNEFASKGIVLKPKVIVRAGPSENDTELFFVHEGTEVKSYRQKSDWIQIRLPDGMSGWVPEDSLEEV